MQHSEAVYLIQKAITSDQPENWADLGCGAGTFTPAVSSILPAVPIYECSCQCNDDWYELIAALIRELIEAAWTREILQIKEKFGDLRF